MLKIQPFLNITGNVRNNLNNSSFRNLSQIMSKSRNNIRSSFVGYKHFLQQTPIFNEMQKSFLSKLTSVPVAKDLSIPDFVLGEIADIKDPDMREEMMNIVRFLLSHEYSEKNIKQCLDYAKNTENSFSKIKLLTHIHSDISILFPLLMCNISSLKAAAKQAPYDDTDKIGFPNRIEYLVHNLEIPPEELIPKITKHPSLLTMSFKRLQLKMTILKQAQIDSEYIHKDLWIFNYNEKLLQNRISAALKAGVELKPWMLRCSEKFFDSVVKKWVQTQEILKGDDEVIYLAKKLDCSEKYISLLMEKNKLLETINIPKIDEILKFLLDQGYTISEIRLFPRVFCCSVQSLRKRIKEFSKIKNSLPTMSQLCCSRKNFEKTRSLYKAASKKEETEVTESN